jgi:hypothetical protein
MKKKWIVILLVAALLLTSGIAIADGQYKKIEVYFSKINLNVNGQPLELSRESILYNGTIYMPLRNLTESLGAEVTWDDVNRSVNLDFIIDDASQLVFSSAKIGIYQYITIQNNDILNAMIDHFKKEDMNGMKDVLARYEQLRQVAVDLQDEEMALVIEKMQASGELMRSGYQSKSLNDYYLAWTIFNTNAGNLVELLRNRIAGSAE